MNISYHEYRTQSPYISPFPDDWGVRHRLSGDLYLCYNTGRGRPELQDKARKPRGVIKEFSMGTGNRMARYLREAEADYRYMHTLTYPAVYPTDGLEVKYHLRRYCQELRRISKRLNHERTSIFWFIEFQSRGAPHFHLLTTDFYSYRRCAQLWYDIVNSGDLKHLKAGVRVERIKKGKKGMITYARKYARKQEQKQVPEDYRNVGRFYGVHGLKKTVAATTTFYNDSLLKPQVKERRDVLNSIIVKLIAEKRITLLKSDYGFRMFHIESLADSYMLKDLLESIDREIEEISFVDDYSDLADDDIELPYLTDEEILRGKMAYIEATKAANGKFWE